MLVVSLTWQRALARHDVDVVYTRGYGGNSVPDVVMLVDQQLIASYISSRVEGASIVVRRCVARQLVDQDRALWGGWPDDDWRLLAVTFRVTDDDLVDSVVTTARALANEGRP